MSKGELYEALATLLEYPEDMDTLLRCLWRVACYLDESGLDCPALPFADFLGESSLTELQEDYVAHFDFNPAKAPYLGHHLYGDNQGKGAYMIRVRQTYTRFGFTQTGCELPDHLSVLLSFLAHLSRMSEDESRRDFIREIVLPGVRKLIESGERAKSPWLPLIETAELLLRADCKEVAS